MNHSSTASTARRRTLAVAFALVVACTALLGVLGYTSLTASPSAATSRGSGQVGGGVTVFDNDVSAVAKLDPDLLDALRRAATDASADGVTFYVTSGWRSRSYQDQLFRQAVSTYGSAEEAARWVARPGTSAHESGAAVDIGRSDAEEWLSTHGASYGLCRIYRNEPWHFERRSDAVDHGCPPMYADPTQDPRMQQ